MTIKKLSAVVSIVLLIALLTSCSKMNTNVLKGKRILFINGETLDIAPNVYDLYLRKKTSITLKGYDNRFINCLCAGENGVYCCSYESGGKVKLLEVEQDRVLRVQEVTLDTQNHNNKASVKKITKFEQGYLFMICEDGSNNEEIINTESICKYDLYQTDFEREPFKIIDGISGYSVYDNRIIYYKPSDLVSNKTHGKNYDMFIMENGETYEIFPLGQCPYSLISGWQSKDVFYSFKEGNLVTYNLLSKEEKVVVRPHGYSFYGDDVFSISDRYVLTFASLPWYKQNPDITYYYLYLFDLKSCKRMLIDDNLCNECQFSYELI